ncbi:MAG: hypothetical protein IK045_08700 [Bacteroidales bacterium]|nr:hypothetical protein [Bacteroidales bacterium]
MKKILFIIALVVLAAGCKKFGTGKEGELRSISFPKSSYEIEAGRSIDIEIYRTPSNSKVPKYTFSSTNPDVAAINGSKIVAKSVGTTTIRAEVKGDPSINCSCAVSVVPANNAVQITSLSVTKDYVEISDLAPDGQADYKFVGVNVSPVEAGWNDISVYSDDEDVEVVTQDGDPLSMKIIVSPNTEHEPTDVRTVDVHLKALKGGKEATVQVKVCGHLRSFGVVQGESNYAISGSTVRLVRGKTFQFNTIVNTTGTLTSEMSQNPVSYSSDNTSLVQVDQSGRLSIPSSASVTGHSDPVHVTISAGYGLNDVKYSVYTYEVPTSYTYDIHMDGNHLLVSPTTSYILSIKSSPENSLCWISLPSPPSQLANVDVTNTDSNQSKITFNVIASSSGEVTISPNAPVKAIQSWKFYADDFLATQPKPGDYVYYDPTLQNKYTWSNGGLLSLTGPRWSSNNIIAPLSGLGTLIGIIYDTFEYTSFPIKLAGLSGKHFKVVSIKDATVGGDNGEGTGKWPWTSYTFDLNDRWNGGSSTLPDGYKSNTYQVNQAIIAYNDSQSDSHYRIRAIYSAQALGDSGSDRLPVAVGTASSIGSTGWMIPLKQDAEDLVDKKAIIERSGNTSGGVKNFVTGTDWYWTGSFKDGSYAYTFNASGVSTAGRGLHYTTRPILFL